jgi:hypothetical protein
LPRRRRGEFALDTQIVFFAAAGAFLLLIVLRRGLRHTRRIEAASVSDQWLAEQKRRFDS